MIEETMAKAKAPAEVWVAQQDTLELKIGLMEEFSASLKTLQSSLSSLQLESTFKSKLAEFSTEGIVTATVTADAAIDQHDIEVVQKALSESRFSEQIDSTMEDAGLTSTQTFYINAGGRRAAIEVTASDTLSTIADKINTATDITTDPETDEAYGDGLVITASVIDNRLVIKSTNTGLGTTTDESTITRGSGTTDKLGFTVAKGVPSNGTLTISDGTTTYTEGTDFEVVSGTDEITWLSGGSAPSGGAEYTVEYTVNSNVFSFDGDTELLELLKFDDSTIGDSTYNVQAQDAIIKIDGLSITRSSNTLDDIIDGVTLEIKGTGSTVMGISQDAESAVTAIEKFVTSYNDAMDWINIRLTEEEQEEQEDDSTNADFYKKFGLLHGDSMLWQAKSQLRQLLSNPVAATYSAKTGSMIFGDLADQGLSKNTTFSVTVGVRTATIEVTPSDTLETIASKINNSHEMNYDSEGREYPIRMASAKVENNKLVIESSTGRVFSLKGEDNILETLGLETPYTLLSQLGISTTSDDYGKSGKLEFDSDKFMAALKEDPDAVAGVFQSAMTNMDDYLDNMVSSTTVEVGTSGVTTPQGRIASQINAWESEISSLDTRISDFEKRLEIRLSRLYDTYANAETQLAKLSQQSSWLSDTVSQLSSSNN